MNLGQLLSNFRFTVGTEETELWRFLSFNFELDNPIVMQRINDKHTAYFDFQDLIVSKSQLEHASIEQAREKFENLKKHHDLVEKQRLDEYHRLINKIKLIQRDINSIRNYFDDLTISNIKTQLEAVSKLAERCL